MTPNQKPWPMGPLAAAGGEPVEGAMLYWAGANGGAERQGTRCPKLFYSRC